MAEQFCPSRCKKLSDHKLFKRYRSETKNTFGDIMRGMEWKKRRWHHTGDVQFDDKPRSRGFEIR